MTEHPGSDQGAEPVSGHQAHDHEHDHDQTPCEAAIEELYLFLDGELTADKRTQIKSHLDDCSPCFEAFDFEAELRNVISTRCRDQVPDSLREAVAQMLESADDGRAGS